MRKRISKQEATLILRDCPEEKAFYVNNGQRLRNLYDLAMALEDMGDNSYSYHFNKDKNDFNKWVNEVINDPLLAKDLSIARNKESAAKKVRIRIGVLKGML